MRKQAAIGLDLLRGLAALEVFLDHIRGGTFVEYGALPDAQRNPLVAGLFGLTRLGHEAVLVFFVLSGYLVCGQLISRARTDTFDARDYVIDRSTRIFLPLIPACLITVALDWSFFGTPINFYQLVLNIAGLNGVLVGTLRLNSALWTLAYEIWFYVIGGAAVYLLCSRKPSSLAFALLAAAVAVFSVLDARFLLFWVMGGMVVLLDQNRHRRRLALLGTATALLGVTLWQLAMQSKSFSSATYLSDGAMEFLVCAGVALTIPFLSDAKTDNFLKPLRKPAQYLSAISFSLYLLHSPINSSFDGVIPRYPSLTLTSVSVYLARAAFTIAIVWLLYALFERNTGKLRRHIKSRWTRVAEPLQS